MGIMGIAQKSPQNPANPAPKNANPPAYNTERRATLLTIEKPIVSLTIKPTTPCVHPVFELQGAPKMLSRVELGSRVLAANDYAWDGRTLWLNNTLRDDVTLRLTFSD